MSPEEEEAEMEARLLLHAECPHGNEIGHFCWECCLENGWTDTESESQEEDDEE